MDVLSQLNDPRYKNDACFEKISRELVSCNDRDIELNNQILKRVIIDTVIEQMKRTDQDFQNLFDTVMYGGSFYKGLKVSKPDEYDLYLVMNLNCSLEVEPSDNNPGFVTIKSHQRQFSRNQNFWNAILDDYGFLNQDKFRNWMHSVLDRSLRTCSKLHCSDKYHMNFRQSGPALNLTLLSTDSGKIDFDLVPCLIFQNKNLRNYRHSTANKWIVVAKPLDVVNGSLLWRTSFYFDDKELLKGEIKSIIRMVKKLRDVRKWSELKSYFIETFFLHLLNENRTFTDNYCNYSKTNVLMFVLRQLQRQLASGMLPQFWQVKQNLFSKMNPVYFTNISNELERLINIIDQNIPRDENILWKIFQSQY